MKSFRRVVFLDAATLRHPLAFDPGLAIDYLACPRSTESETAALIADADIVVTNKVRITAGHLATARRLRLICVAAAGTDNIDMAAAAARGIEVRNVPDYGSDSVAEHAIAALMALRRSLPAYARAATDGTWSTAGQFCWHGPAIREVGGSTLVIVGRGRIGQALARMAQGLGMRVLFAAAPGRAANDDLHDLDDILPQVDALSLHLPLTAQTRGLMGRERLGRMRPDAVLLNTGRGALVDAHALADALRGGRLGGAALDVLDPEPPPPDHPLLAHDIPNLLITPHVAWAGTAAQARLADRLSQMITIHFQGAA